MSSRGVVSGRGALRRGLALADFAQVVDASRATSLALSLRSRRRSARRSRARSRRHAAVAVCGRVVRSRAAGLHLGTDPGVPVRRLTGSASDAVPRTVTPAQTPALRGRGGPIGRVGGGWSPPGGQPPGERPTKHRSSERRPRPPPTPVTRRLSFRLPTGHSDYRQESQKAKPCGAGGSVIRTALSHIRWSGSVFGVVEMTCERPIFVWVFSGLPPLMIEDVHGSALAVVPTHRVAGAAAVAAARAGRWLIASDMRAVGPWLPTPVQMGCLKNGMRCCPASCCRRPPPEPVTQLP